jgi:hypothetical protein
MFPEMLLAVAAGQVKACRFWGIQLRLAATLVVPAIKMSADGEGGFSC